MLFRLEDLPQSLTFWNTPDGLPLLLVTFKARFMIIAQRRLDYYQENSMWSPIATSNLRNSPFTLAGASMAFGGSVVVALSNQLHLYSRTYIKAQPQGFVDIFTSVHEANNALPDYHPQLLVQCLLSGK